jgi:hypothetical protein
MLDLIALVLLYEACYCKVLIRVLDWLLFLLLFIAFIGDFLLSGMLVELRGCSLRVDVERTIFYLYEIIITKACRRTFDGAVHADFPHTYYF